MRIYPEKTVPSLSSVKRILDKAGLVEKRKIRKPASSDCPRLQRQIQAKEPNDVWCIDFKGFWKSDGEICEPFTVRDKATRKILCTLLMTSKSSDAVKTVMQGLFRKYGLPKAIHSDNGAPFACSNGVLNLTSLSIWWITLGIMPNRPVKGCPGQNGSLERMHADIAREIEGKVAGSIKANQIVLNEWVKDYNSLCPNEAIGMKVPDDLYHISGRKYIGDFDELEYPMGYLVRKVNCTGEILMNSIRISISHALKDYQVGLRPQKEGVFDVFISDFLLGTLDLNSSCFYPLTDLKSK